MLTQSPPMQTLSNNPIRRAWSYVRADWRAYITINAVYYGLVVLGMLYVALMNPALQQSLLESVGMAFTQGPLAAVGSAYNEGQVFSAIALTLIVNLFLGSLIEITLPSLIIPFTGLLMGAFRAVLWGLLLSPSNPTLAGAMIPHSLTLLLEGQAYILALLAVFIQGKALFRPSDYGTVRGWPAYKEGVRRTAWIYVLVALTLAIAAIYEALEVIYLAPLFV